MKRFILKRQKANTEIFITSSMYKFKFFRVKLSETFITFSLVSKIRGD